MVSSLELLKIAAPLMTFMAVALGLHVVLKARAQRSSVRAGLSETVTEIGGFENRAAVMRAPFMKRVMKPASKHLASVVYRFGPAGLREQTRERLILAGMGKRIDPDLFMALSLAAPLVVAGIMLGLKSQLQLTIALPLWLIVPASATFPKMWLTGRVEARQREIRLALSDTIDMLTIAVEAGLGFDSALARVVGTIPGALSNELYRMLQELRIGIPRHEAFANLSERTGVQELDEFITAMNQAEGFGVSIGRVLRAQADRLRQRRSQVAEERAAKTPVKLLFPLLLCIFPGLFTVLVGPAAITIMEKMYGM